MDSQKLRKDLEFLKKYEVVVYGSHVTGDARPGSDIDIAVISRTESAANNKRLLTGFIGKAPPIYDMRIFELLPLKVKASIMDDYRVLFGDGPEISYYFYQYRKIWDDCKHRILEGYHTTYRDKVRSIKRGKAVIAAMDKRKRPISKGTSRSTR
jgi:predicted nucleotidyltransferase